MCWRTRYSQTCCPIKNIKIKKVFFLLFLACKIYITNVLVIFINQPFSQKEKNLLRVCLCIEQSLLLFDLSREKKTLAGSCETTTKFLKTLFFYLFSLLFFFSLSISFCFFYFYFFIFKEKKIFSSSENFENEKQFNIIKIRKILLALVSQREEGKKKPKHKDTAEFPSCAECFCAQIKSSSFLMGKQRKKKVLYQPKI